MIPFKLTISHSNIIYGIVEKIILNIQEALMNMDPGNPNWEFLAMIREYQSSIEFRPLVGSEPVEDHQITVCVRKRPLNKKEINKKEVPH